MTLIQSASGPIRVLHLGLGRFHRAHQAVYMQRLSALGDSSWGISAFSMRSSENRDRLRAAGLKYPVVETERAEDATPGESKRSQIIQAETPTPHAVPGFNVVWVDVIRETGFAVIDRDLLLARARDAGVKIVTLTITEKGYCLSQNGELNLADPEIQADLALPLEPKTAIGILALILRERALHGRKALTVVSCDNIRENGRKLDRAIRTYLSRLNGDGWDKALEFVADEVPFPNSMVDRIVPELSPETKSSIESRCGVSHPELLATEEFTQWVIEDRFAGGRPSWDRVFVEFVRDIKPFEEMKLRLLNATHSLLAYLGILRGHSFVHEAINDPSIASLARELMIEEVSPLLEKYHRKDKLHEYCESLLMRFANDALPHRLPQIAADGSEKIPQRILPSLSEALSAGSKHDALTTALGAWILFLHSQITAKREILDPRRTKILTLFEVDIALFVKKILSDRELLGPLSTNPKVLNEVTAKIGLLRK